MNKVYVIRKRHIRIWHLAVFFLLLCIAAYGGNFYLKQNYAAAFDGPEPVAQPGMSALHESGDGIYRYRIQEEDNTCEIVFYSKDDEENLIVPEKIDGHPVGSIGEAAFAYHRELASITFPDTVSTIRLAAFAGCDNLDELYFPGKVTECEEYSLDGFKGTVYTVKNSGLFEYALHHGIDVEALECR